MVPNELNDFSAYSAACADLVRGGLRFGGGDVFIFANDTLFLKHPAPSLLRLLRRTLPSVREAAVPILSGKADSYRALLQTSPFAVGLDRYVATFLFATNAQGVSLLDAVFHSVETKVLLDGVASMIGAGVPKKFFAFLRMHLGDSASVFAWHGERAPEMISRKACCVLLEHLVSAKFFEEGFLAPINSSAILNGGMLASYAIRGVKRKIARRRDRLD
ncbi:MAG: hypothetical protein ACRES7_11510 [Gammaproteobacteria bacterium]